MNMMNILFLGDSHGKWQSFENKIITHNLQDVNIIHLGDGAFGFCKYRKEDQYIVERLNNFCASRNIILYNVQGNHDHPFWFKSESALIKYFKNEDSKVSSLMKNDFYYKSLYLDPTDFAKFIKNLSNVKFLINYDIINIDGLNILPVGGATSIDRLYQQTQSNYFTDEKVVYSNKIKKLSNVDIVVSHTCPDFVSPRTFAPLVYQYAKQDKNLIYELTQERKLMTKIYKDLIKKNNIRCWFFGHYHHHIEEKFDNCTFRCFAPLELFEMNFDLF